MIPRSLRVFPVVVTLLLAASAALAQELVLFEHPRFEGRSVRLTRGTDDLRSRDFGGVASSVRVLSGAWTVCSEPGLRGQCVVFTGDLPDLRVVNFGDRAMSAAVTLLPDRRDEGHEHHHGHWSPEPKIVLFDGPNYSGETRTITGPVATLRSMSFNDRTSSLRIEGGAWEICSDADFRGRCELFVRSARDLGEARWVDSISSLRPVPLAELPEGWRPLEGGREPQLLVYQHTGFRGREVGIAGAVPDLAHIGFKGEISSLRIRSGAWLFCTEPGFRGQCRVFVNDQPDLRAFDLNDRVASIKPAHW